jgi:hypothetical protein
MDRIRINSRRRGMSSVLAMLFLIIFSTMAVGFYATTATQSQVAASDRRIARAYTAAESGMDFMRYQLGGVSIPPGTASDDVVAALFEDLQLQLDETGNLGKYSIVQSGNTIYIPDDGEGTIPLDADGDSRFRATITDWAGEIVVKVEGINGGGENPITRAITMDFTRVQHATSVFDYAVASKGQVLMQKGTVSSVAGVDPAIATVMSALEADPSLKVTGGTIGGELNIVDDAHVAVTGGTVAGSSIPAVILANHTNVVDKPEFPTIDTTVYKKYAVNDYKSGAATQQNIRIPANTNPKFNGKDTVQGIMYIESPNTVEFRGNFNLQGFIVFENAGTSADNVLDFRGNVAQLPLPAGAQFDALRTTSGVAILAPTAAVTMSGSTDSTLRGNVILGSFSFAGSADIVIDQGTLMTYNETNNSVVFNGKTVKFTATGANNMPTSGVSYSAFYQPNAASYQEVSP